MMHADLIDQDDLAGHLRARGFDIPAGASAEQACEAVVRGLTEPNARALKGMVEQMYTGSATILPAVRQAIDKQLLPAMGPVRFQSLTLAKVDSLRAWLSAAIGPLCGDSAMACGIGIIATCCAVLEPTRSSRGGMPKYSR